METYFADPARADEKELLKETAIIDKSPVMNGLLQSIGGMLAILDEHRQILALNYSLLKTLGIDDAYKALGLRAGEIFQCIHAHDEPAGCGTTKFCSTCGAAIAIVSSLAEDHPVERICALTARRADTTVDIALLVRSSPIKIDNRRFLLLFLQDITQQQQRAALERTFFHDINNLLVGLVGATDLLSMKNSESDLVKIISQSSIRISSEIEMQRCLLKEQDAVYQPVLQNILPQDVIKELQAFFTNHPAALNRNVDFSLSESDLSVRTDISLLLRVLCNMVTNALESTDQNGVVKVWSEQNDHLLSFCVWNDKQIKEDLALRIFQRNFSTKEGDGRGIGTYSMKLFGEKYLGGKVSFTTSQQDGTVFKITLSA